MDPVEAKRALEEAIETGVSMTEEVWRPVVGAEGLYEVSNLGRVRGVDRVDGQGRHWPGRIRALGNTGKYKTVPLYIEGRQTPKIVHRLVLESFVGPCPDGMEACHNDGNPHNNRLDNLRWDTHTENMYDVVRHGRHHLRNATHCKRGHEFTERNLTQWALRQGLRRCLACERAASDMKRGRATDRDAAADRHYARILQAA